MAVLAGSQVSDCCPFLGYLLDKRSISSIVNRSFFFITFIGKPAWTSTFDIYFNYFARKHRIIVKSVLKLEKVHSSTAKAVQSHIQKLIQMQCPISEFVLKNILVPLVYQLYVMKNMNLWL